MVAIVHVPLSSVPVGRQNTVDPRNDNRVSYGTNLWSVQIINRTAGILRVIARKPIYLKTVSTNDRFGLNCSSTKNERGCILFMDIRVAIITNNARLVKPSDHRRRLLTVGNFID